jgi:catecholate siderophore receptor
MENAMRMKKGKRNQQARSSTTRSQTASETTSGSNHWPVAYRWAAMGTLMIYSALGSKTIHLARAQTATGQLQPGPIGGQTNGAQRVWRFEIAPGPLETVVAAFQNVTGLTVVVAKEGIRSLPSAGVSGVYTADQALQRMLRDTGLSYSYTSATTVTVDLKAVAASVEVTANVDALAISSPKYAQPRIDTPQTIASVSSEIIQQQGATTLRDTLRNFAGISLAAGEGGAQGDNLTIRGFTARNDLFIDGMRDFGSYYRDPFNVEEVQVLQGPSSVTFGRGSTGGVVNQTSKTPFLTKALSGEGSIGTDRTRRVTLDFNQPIHNLGKGAAFRLNLMGDQGNVAGRDVAENRRVGVAPSLALGLGTQTRWTFSYFHQNADDNPDYGIPWLFNGPAPVPHHNYYGFKKGNYLRTYDDIGTVRVEHSVSGGISIRNQVRFAHYQRDALITEAQVAAGVTSTTPLAKITVNRRQIGVDSVESSFDEQLDVTAHFETGSIRHDLVSGIEVGRETSDPTRPTWSNVPSTSLLEPNPDDSFRGSASITSKVQTRAVTTSAYALDSARLGAHWILSGGVRWDRMTADYNQYVAPVASFHRVDNMPSWKAALVYKPASYGSIYFDAGTSFNPSAESLSLSSSTANLPPEKNRTYELGTKWDLPDNWLSIRGAVFQTLKLNAREPDPANPVLNVLAGTQRVRGVQAEIRARLTGRWDLMASYAFLDAKVVGSNYYPSAIGARLANVPENTLGFWSTYRLPWRCEVGAGGSYVSSRTASSTAPLDSVTGRAKEAPGYWVFNAMFRRRLVEHLDLQANLYNLTDRYYYDQLHPAHIVPGPGRSALLGFHFRF